MDYQKCAYELGTKVARFEALKGFWGKLLGRNVRQVHQAQLDKLMKNKFLQKELKGVTGAPDTVEAYLRNALKGKGKGLPSAQGTRDYRQMVELPEKLSPGHKRLINQVIRGQKAVAAAQAAAARARLGTAAAAIPVLAAGGVGLATSDDAPTPEKVADAADVVPAAAGVAAGSLPIAQGLRSGALTLRAPKEHVFSSLAELRKALRPGDILLETNPGLRDTTWKPLITALGADPTRGHHVTPVVSVPRMLSDMAVGALEAGPSVGVVHSDMPLREGADYTIRRLKDKKDAARFVKNLKNHARSIEPLGELFGSAAVKSTYDQQAAIRAGIGSVLPNKANQLLAGGAPDAGRAICSSTVGICSPVELQKGVPRQHILPHHIARSAELETVGRLKAPRTLKQKWIERALRASPWALRGALGLGLGYGAYKGISALFGDDEEPTDDTTR